MQPHKMRLIAGVSAPQGSIPFEFEHKSYTALPGESIASALMRAGVQEMRLTRRAGESRGYFCGMGICWECAVFVEGRGVVRGCGEPVTAGMVLRFAEAEI